MWSLDVGSCRETSCVRGWTKTLVCFCAIGCSCSWLVQAWSVEGFGLDIVGKVDCRKIADGCLNMADIWWVCCCC